jgi:hypothetical protein
MPDGHKNVEVERLFCSTDKLELPTHIGTDGLTLRGNVVVSADDFEILPVAGSIRRPKFSVATNRQTSSSPC